MIKYIELENIFRFFDYNSKNYFNISGNGPNKIQDSLIKIVEFNYVNNFLTSALLSKKILILFIFCY